MKYFLPFFFLSLFLVACEQRPEPLSAGERLQKQLDALETALIALRDAAAKGADGPRLQSDFKACRLLYKQSEWAVEYFQPAVARFINGPALDETEAEENRYFPPAGFQVVEELLFPAYDPASRNDLTRETGVLLSNVRQIRTHLRAVVLTDAYLFDALQQQFARLMALGITGFDSPIARHAVPETQASLASAQVLLRDWQLERPHPELDTLLGKAISFCARNGDFDTFDRAAFLTGHMIPIGRKMQRLRTGNRIATVPRMHVVRSSAATFFEKDAFDPGAFIPSAEYAYSQEKVALGEALFHDTRLSRDGGRSCASCHHPDKAFTDGLPVNLALDGHALQRNTPTLTYASFQNAFFWDLRQPDLEKQSLEVIRNKDEMHGDLSRLLPALQHDPHYAELFKKAFPKATAAENWQLQNAIASYVRSLSPFDSRFDRYMQGDAKALSADEQRGMNLFMGKAKCATCHFTPLFNGTVPPRYAKTEQEVIGTPETPEGNAISDDPGRFGITRLPQFRHAFKTPTLRNVALTAPYMHNGVYRTLDEVIDFYDKGGGTGLGYTVDHQTLPPERLHLTPAEKKQLIAFLGALTDKRYEAPAKEAGR